MSARHRVLFDAEPAVADAVSEWFYTGNLEAVTVHFFGITTGDELQVEGTNEGDAVSDEETTAADGNEVSLLDANVTADDMIELPTPPAFIRVKFVAVAGGGSASALAYGRLRDS